MNLSNSSDALQRKASSIAKRVLTLASDIRAESFELAWQTMEQEHWPDLVGGARRASDGPAREEQLAEIVHELHRVLSEAEEWQLAPEFDDAEPWSLGSKFEVLSPRKILRGFLVPVREMPTGIPVSPQVFAFLTIEGDRDLLVRENHGFGMHFHYVLADKTRTTTMICWDTRWISSDKNEPKGLVHRPIFHQLHAEGARTATARPDDWGDKKRQSVRTTCVPSLRKQNVGDFLCALDGASAVWPRNARLTPRPAAVGKGRD